MIGMMKNGPENSAKLEKAPQKLVGYIYTPRSDPFGVYLYTTQGNPCLFPLWDARGNGNAGVGHNGFPLILRHESHLGESDLVVC